MVALLYDVVEKETIMGFIIACCIAWWLGGPMGLIIWLLVCILFMSVE